MNHNGHKLYKPRNDDHQNMYGIRKVTYWEKYGVKRFPYRGKRRYTPLIYQASDGGITISNDVFGLTIRQFEEMFKDCLDRRKQQEQWILNLRYPDKSSNEYLEYLQNCSDCNKDHLLWPGCHLKEKYLYEHLVNTVGTEIDIRTRQRLFIIDDMIKHVGFPLATQISSGSLAEGLDLPGSDLDIMIVIEFVNVLRNARDIKYPLQCTTLVMERDIDHPGFTKLRLLAEEHDDSNIGYEFLESTREGEYVSVNAFVNEIKKSFEQQSMAQLYSHGPCLSDKDQITDIACCFQSKCFPYQAIPWSFRHRKQWPPNNVIEIIINNGCLLVPIGPKGISDTHLLWRLSFSVAEKQLVHSFNFTQFFCYGLLKLTLKQIINTIDEVKGLLCSYFLKTALFWVSEEVDIETFQLPNFYICFSRCINKLISWVNNCYCPNYFIPEHNMFTGKITPDNNNILLHVLNSVLLSGINGLILNLAPPKSVNNNLLSNVSFIKLDFLFYRMCGLLNGTDISGCYKVLQFIESLLKSESSTFIIDICKYHYAKTSQYAAQLLPTPTTQCVKYKMCKCYQRHLQDGIKTDAVSGWLLYASYYYVTGQYQVALRLADYALSKCTPDMVYIGFPLDEDDISKYKQYAHYSVALNAKIKIAMVNCVTYMERSPFIPAELQSKFGNTMKCIPPIVMSHFLKFLCYHHLCDILKRQQALVDLYCTVERRQLMKERELSDSFTILSVCFEISGVKDRAYQYYYEALQCD